MVTFLKIVYCIKTAIYRPFLKEFRVVGQICREGIDENGILPKARHVMTVFHCLEWLVVWVTL